MSKRNACVFESMERRTLMSGGTLPMGEVVAGEVGSVGAQEQWTFDAGAGDTVAWALTSTPTQAGFEALLELFEPSGQRKTWRTAGGYGNLTLDQAGTHMLVVRDYDDAQTGRYSLCVEPVNRVAPDAAPLVKGGIISGTVGTRIERDQWTFDGRAGDLVTFALTSTPAQAGFEALAEVFAPSGTQATWFTAGGRHTLTLAETGTYTVALSDYDAVQTGAYTLGFEGINPISPGAAPLAHGGLTSGTIAAGNDVDQLTFTGKAGDRFALALDSTATVTGFEATVELYAPSGTRVNWFTAGGQRVIDLPEDGTYLVDVHDYDYAQTGAYTVGLESLSPPSPNPLALPHGLTRHGANEVGIDVDQYAFTARAGEQVRLTLASTPTDAGYNAIVTVFDAAGAQRLYAYAGTTTFVAPRDGAYLVQVHDADFAQRGRYSLTMNRVASPTGTIAGRLFHDRHGDGKLDRADTGVGGWLVYLDANGNGRRDRGEPWSRSDADGVWWFDGRRAGTYTVRPELPRGYVHTTGAAGARTITLKKGQSVVTDVGVARPVTVAGQVFSDANGNGRRDRAERFAAGWVVFADANGNGKRDRGERYAVTDSNGRWSIDGLAPGEIVVRTQKRRGFTTTTPARDGVLRLKLASNGRSQSNPFGVSPIG